MITQDSFKIRVMFHFIYKFQVTLAFTLKDRILYVYLCIIHAYASQIIPSFSRLTLMRA